MRHLNTARNCDFAASSTESGKGVVLELKPHGLTPETFELTGAEAEYLAGLLLNVCGKKTARKK